MSAQLQVSRMNGQLQMIPVIGALRVHQSEQMI